MEALTHLQHTDYLALLGLIGEVSAACSLDDFRRRAVAALRRLVPSEIASHVEMRPSERARSLVEPSDVHFPEGDEILARHGTDNPLIAHFHRSTDDQVLKLSDFIDRHELHCRELYQHLYRRVGTEHQIAFGVPSRKPSIAVMALSRRHRDFDERDRQLLSLARPHLIQAQRNAARLDQMQEAITHGGQGMIELDRNGRARFATRHAEQMLDTYFGRVRGGSELPDDLREWVRHERSRLAVGTGSLAPARDLVVERAGRRLVARFVPGDDASEADLVLLTETSDFAAVDHAALGLSPREVEVLRLVAHGQTDAQIAEVLVVSPRTIHKHLEHVYEKLGVRTRTAAVHRAFGKIGVTPDDSREPAA
jgi:DNA-binding CsgD family transcriptional regulator